VDGVLISSSTTSLPSSFTHAINTTGEHVVELTAVDGANNIDATVVTIIVRDGTKPVVGDIVANDTVMVGTAMTFSVSATDPESELLRYNWDFDKEVDSDGDSVTGNDVDATGSTVSWSFSTAKPTYVTVTVTNDENDSKTVQILIDVEADPNAVSGSSSPLDNLVPFIILVIIVVLGAGGWFAWRKRKEMLYQEAVSLAKAASEEEEQGPEPERDDQLTMYAPAASQSGGYGGGGDDSIAALAGTGYSQGIVSEDALAAFGEDDENPEVAKKDPILDDLDFLRSKDEKPATEVASAEPEQQADSSKPEGKVAKRSSGIALPDSAGVATSRQTVQPKAAPVQQDSPTAKPVAEPEPEGADSTTVKASCPSCEQMFAVDMPNDIEQALVAFPKCDQRIRLEK
ncbi:MAG: PKD domain-containing protein, partial [Candidatus Poseidoniales archaeon]|nr:PKD domain-containing protein [Candidatus Poseidoniales archaeon]